MACALCRHTGKDYNHRVGSAQCVPVDRSMNGNRNSQIQKEILTPMDVVDEESVRGTAATASGNDA